MKSKLHRRQFLQAGAALAASTVFAPASAALARLANGKLRTAHVGVGGMGGADLASISSHPMVEVAALCDVDAGRLQAAAQLHPKAKTFRDYREMFDALGDSIDAAVVSTPDHTHAPAAMTALNHGKHVYCQKPLTHEAFEARQLRLAAEKTGLVTQMGIQVHSSAPYRRAVKIVQSGVIGKVREVHAWSNKNWGYDASSLPAPATAPADLDFGLWLGVAAERPYAPEVYHPANWRKLIDFGTGTLGDMGVHIFDTPYAALELTSPNWVETTCRAPTGVGHPEKNIVRYEFPETSHTAEKLLWTWYDGEYAPPKAADLGLASDVSLPDQGSLFIGEEGVLLLPHVAEAELFPREKFRDYRPPEVQDEDHYHQWVNACLGQGVASAPFSYGGPLTEALLLGVIANRFPGQRLAWDAKALQFSNHAAANGLVSRPYRKGFEVAGL